MSKQERAKMILAMEYVVRQVNDEEVFEQWLLEGVADGDLERGAWNVEDVDDYYLYDENFAYIMRLFLRVMRDAYRSGGLYCDDVLSGDRDDDRK